MRAETIFFIAVIVIALFYVWSSGMFVSVPTRSINDLPNAQLLVEPAQLELNAYQVQSFRFYDDEAYQIQPLFNFELVGRVLSTERYHLGNEADLSPVDFALGWSHMAEDGLLERLSISQGGRWYRWYTDDRSININDIVPYSSNIHMVPADDSIRRQLLSIDEDDLIYLRGYLIEASKSEGGGTWRWISSLTRFDTGNGACELFYVEDLALLE